MTDSSGGLQYMFTWGNAGDHEGGGLPIGVLHCTVERSHKWGSGSKIPWPKKAVGEGKAWIRNPSSQGSSSGGERAKISFNPIKRECRGLKYHRDQGLARS